LFNIFTNGPDEWKGCQVGKLVDINILQLGRNNPTHHNRLGTSAVGKGQGVLVGSKLSLSQQ